MKRTSAPVWLLTLGWLCLPLTGVQAGDPDDFFEAKIRPVLLGTCFRCHGDLKTSARLRVDSRSALVQGGSSGPAIEPGNPEDSLLILALTGADGVSAMPPERDKTLRPDQVADFVAWVKAGAVWPENTAKFVAARHWAFEPVQNPNPPAVQNLAWVQTPPDRFVLALQEAAGVGPAPRADKRTLIRRATFDLTGLPPTAEEVEAFECDEAPEAFAALVDRLLESPAYGERWGRHWLDVVRYADTAGETADYPVPLAWRYRQYVVNAFHADKPYDAFLREQLAGDILGGAGPVERYAEQAAATGYLAISRRFGFDSENYHHLTIQDTIDTLGQSVLGLSLGCARCHDHKFDPVSAQDYYALYGIFDSSRYAFPGSEQKQKVRSMLPLVPPAESKTLWRAHEQKLAALRAELAAAGQAAPAGVLRSLHEMDGDFELQAPAAGGSNGVLVPPWLYQGKIAVTAAAQSPFQNLYAGGRVGASIPAGPEGYQIEQAIHPALTARNASHVYLNLDLRVAGATSQQTGRHGLSLGPVGGAPVVTAWISAESLTLQAGEAMGVPVSLKPGLWQNLQLVLDLEAGTVAGRLGTSGEVIELAPLPVAGLRTAAVALVKIQGQGAVPALEFDNLAVQDAALAPVSVRPATAAQASNVVGLNAELLTLTGLDGDLELQTAGAAPSAPWNPGPNSVVKISDGSQSPFRNQFPAGKLGIHAPNRGEYDGFGLALANIKPADDGRLFVSLDFRPVSQAAGGAGTWRYYLGHGPGNSAAIELFFNGTTFFRKSGTVIGPVGPLEIGRWYQVQLTLNLNQKTYQGILASDAGQLNFEGELVSAWDGGIDYTFIDSYGHMAGVRPALDVDQFVISASPLPLPDAPAVEMVGDQPARRARAAEIRGQLAALKAHTDDLSRDLSRLLVSGPYPMTYGVVEGTPHNVRLQQRGEPDQPGAEVPRGFLKVLGGGTLPPGATGSGRLELAEWLTRPENPLTARVMMNRIWQYHFGQGLVKTPNDFGVRGQPPSHPELLDYLATQFVGNGWSIKAMHRLIMNSSTYQQASDPQNGGSPDPALDRAGLLVGYPQRRLSAEEIRDAILAVSGELDRTPGGSGEHPFPSPLSWGFSQHAPFLAVYDHNQRSLYLMTQRLKRHPFLALFDGADPNASTPQRQTTTVPTQALFFLNDLMVYEKSEKWAGRLLTVAGTDEPAQIELAWRQALGRVPTQAERAEAVQFLSAYRGELAGLNLNNPELRSLAAYLRTLLASNEFLHVN